MRRVRRQRGATMGLIIALCCLMAAIVAGMFRLTMLLGGGQETRNAVDAGALNVGKDVFSAVKTKASDADEEQFEDVADSKGEFNLANINRVWAKALLMNENAAAMNGSGAAQGHAQAIYDAAQRISDRLSDKLNDPENLYPLFNKFSRQNSVRMLGAGATVEAAGNGWMTSYVNRGAQTNIEVRPEQFASQAAFDALEPVKVNEKFYLKGYQPINVLGKNFVFVPFESDAIPHLISKTTFEQNSAKNKNISFWNKPIPNAFAAHGNSIDSSKAIMQAVSYVQANPNRQAKFGAPHAFVRIKLPGNKVRFSLNNTAVTEISHDFLAQGIMQSAPAGIGQLNVTANLGLKEASLFNVLYNEPGSKKEMTAFLLQRIKQINPDFGVSDLFSLLKSQRVEKGTEEYFIYADEIGKVAISGKDSVASKASWLKTFAKPDGLLANLVNDKMTDVPGLITSDLIGNGLKVFGMSSVQQENIFDLTPATGFDGCLGELSAYQVTNIAVTAEVLKPADPS